MAQLVRWKKGKKPWSKWHLTDDGVLTVCGLEIMGPQDGTSIKQEVKLEGVVECGRCDYSYFGLMPQFRRIQKGLQSSIRDMKGGT